MEWQVHHMPVLSPVQMADGTARAFLNLTIHIDVL
jgi:hypothetical protein